MAQCFILATIQVLSIQYRTTVQNGQTYYYAIAAYDKGYTTTTIEGNFEGIPPSETTTILKKDINGNITTDINTAVITPRAPAAGYLAPEVASFVGSGPGTEIFHFNSKS